jgi:ABC-type branched-subunit amino acid transport system ATPase component
MQLLQVQNLTRRVGGLSAASDPTFAVGRGEIGGSIEFNRAGKTMQDGPLDQRGGRGRFRLN